MKDYDTQSLMLAEHFLLEEKPKGMSDHEFDKHADRLAGEIQHVVEQFCDFDEEWLKALGGAGE